MTFVEVILDARIPPNALRAAVNGERVTITVSPEVEAAALAVLDEAIGMAVAEVMDQAGSPGEEPAAPGRPLRAVPEDAAPADGLAPFRLDEFEYLQVADRIAARIRAGEFSATGRLPSEPELGRHYSVGTGVIRHARQELLRRGLIAVDPGNRGKGTFIT